MVEQRARIAFRQELRDRPPSVATLHEARDEEHHRSRMMPINRTYAPLKAFVDELVRCGMTHAVTSPGSRSAPLALTLAAQDGLEAVSVIDERSAGFFALGMAKATGRRGSARLGGPRARDRGGCTSTPRGASRSARSRRSSTRPTGRAAPTAG